METAPAPEPYTNSHALSTVAELAGRRDGDGDGDGDGKTSTVPGASISAEKSISDQPTEQGAAQNLPVGEGQPPRQHTPLSSGDGARVISDKRTASHIVTPAASPALDVEKIDKAEVFLRNSEIRDVSAGDKRMYLKSKTGMTPQEIDAALDRVAGKEGVVGARGDDADGRSQPNGREYYDRGDGRNLHRYNDSQAHGRQGDYRRRNQNQQYQDDSYSPLSGPERQPPPQHYTPQSYNNTQAHMRPPPGSPEREEATSALPALMGGFSLGVFCLAALRWLNGGDFVLFPPPAASEPSLVPKRSEGQLLDNIEEDTDESDSNQQEEDELAEDEEHEGYESDSNDGDDLSTILNDTTKAQSFHPENSSQPSYNELVLEIRSLTSAIHSYRDVQERANRAVTAQAGKGMTDDAMDFLRQKKSEMEPSQDGDQTTALDEKGISTISTLLAEVSDDLSQLKDRLSEGVEVNDDDYDDNKAKVDPDGATDKHDKDNGQPLKKIDEVIEKIQKMMEMIPHAEPNEKGSVDSNNLDKIDGDHAGEGESKGLSTELIESSTPLSTPTTQMEEKQSQESAQQQPSNETTHSNDELESALNTLGSSNSAEELKAGSQMLYLYCLNISKNPSVPRYRKIYTNNNTFRNKVGNLVGAKEFLSAVGFVERTNFLEWAQSDDASLVKSRLDFALVALELLKNGPKLKEDDATVPLEPNEIAPEAPDFSLTSDGKSMDLN